MVVSAVLLPNDTDSAELVACSQRLSESISSLLLLGENALPHITLAQFNISDEVEAEQLWREIEQGKDSVKELISGGLSFVPSTTHNQTWIELQFLSTTELGDLRSAVLGTTFAQKSKLITDTQNGFRPHCTLGLVEGQSIPAINLREWNVFKRKFSQLQLAVGINGPNFTLAEAKFR